MNPNIHSPKVTPPARKEFLSDRWMLWLFVIVQLIFATSVAVALLTADARQPFFSL
jgi:hypothetical protein